MSSAAQRLSAQNKDVHQMILVLDDELSEARSTIVTMENKYGKQGLQMINKWTSTELGLYEEVRDFMYNWFSFHA